MNAVLIKTIGDLKKLLEQYPDTVNLGSLVSVSGVNHIKALYISETNEIGDRDSEDIPVLVFLAEDSKPNNVHFKKPRQEDPYNPKDTYTIID